MKEKRQYIPSIPFMQLVCGVLIVVLHSNNISGYAFDANFSLLNYGVYIFEEFITMFGHLALPVYFYITGFLTFLNYKNSKIVYLNKIKNRIRTLVIPYIIWNALTVIFYWVLSNIPFIASKLNHMFVPNNLWFILKAILSSDYTPLWYIKNIFILTIFSIAFYQIIKIKNLAILSLSILIIINLFYQFDYFGFIYWLPIYLLGAVHSIHKRRLFSFKNVDTRILLHIILMFLLVINVFMETHILMYIYRLLAAIVCIDLFTGIYNKKIDNNFNKWYKFSFFIYCTHFVVISIYQKLLLLIGGNNSFNTLFSYVSSPIVCLLIIIALAKLINKKFHKLWGVLTGGR